MMVIGLNNIPRIYYWRCVILLTICYFMIFIAVYAWKREKDLDDFVWKMWKILEAAYISLFIFIFFILCLLISILIIALLMLLLW